METQQSINFLLVEISYMMRRNRRGMEAHDRLVATGKKDGYIRIAWGWIVDCLLTLFDLIWAIVQPILMMLVMMIVRVMLIIFFTALVIYILYKLITA